MDWINIEDGSPSTRGYYRVQLDDGTEMKSYYHTELGFTRFWQKLPRVVRWRNETPREKGDWQVKSPMKN